MAIGPLVNLAGGVIQSLFHGSSNPAPPAANTAFGQILDSLRHVQQSSPAQYQSVTRRISTNLAAGAQSATAGGNSLLAGELSRLSADFTVASNSGQLPAVDDLAQALAGRAASSIVGSALSAAGLPIR
jgi:hypothetical protein